MESTYQKELGVKTLLCESHGEFHLPDYAGDMKKILASSARVLPAGKFIGEEEVQFGGTVCYDIWYLDAENRLTHEGFTSDYEFSCPKGEDTVDGSLRPSVVHFSLRPAGPRRISAKAALEGKMTLRASKEYACTCEAEDAILHTQSSEVSVGHRIFSAPMEREYAESLPLYEGYDGRADVIFSEGYVHLESAEAMEDCVLVRGSVAVAVVLSGEAMPPVRITQTYPLEERVPLEGASEDMAARADGYITSLTVNVREEQGPQITLHAICELTAEAEKNVSFSVVEDAFIERNGGDCECDRLEYETFGPSQMTMRSPELRLPLAEGESPSDGIFHTVVQLKNETYTEGDKELCYAAEAEIAALGYGTDAEGLMHYTVHRACTPISLSIPLPDAYEKGWQYITDARVCMCEGWMEDEMVFVKPNIQFCVRAHAPSEISCIRRILPCTEDAAVFVPTYAVYYPKPEDSLWSIAKRYSVSPASVAACNHLAFETAGVAEKLPGLLLVDRRKK